MAEKSLLIHKFENSNCGGFRGTHSIEFSIDKEKNFTVVMGASGKGKSTTFGLIYWCLFGKFYRPKDSKTLIYEGLIHKKLLKELEIGKKITGSVTLTINDEDGERYVLTRSLTATKLREESGTTFEKLNNSRVYKGTQFETDVKMRMENPIEGGLDTETNEGVINNELRQFLPIALSDFALFDGENLKDFQTPEDAREIIIDGIKKLSGLPIVDEMIKSVEKTHGAITIITGKKGGASGAALAGALEQAREDKKKAEDIIEDVEKQKKVNQILYDEITNEMRKSKTGKDISKRIKEQEGKLTELNNERRKHDKKVKVFLFRKIPYLLIRKTLLKSQDDFSRLEELQKIPPTITSEGIDKIRSTLKCLCGRDFEKPQFDSEGKPLPTSDGVWDELGRVKETIIDNERSAGIYTGRGLISQIVDQSIPEKINEIWNELDETKTTFYKNQRIEIGKLEDLKDERSQLPNEGELNFDELQKKSNEIWGQNGELNLQSTEAEAELEDAIENIKKLDKELTELTGLGKKHKIDLAKMEILKAIEKISKEKKKIITGKLKNVTEQATNKYFMDSAPEVEDFDRVEITSNYDILALDSDGDAKETSMGQSHVLGLSYVMGCRSIANTNTFLFIDSPLHNISGTFRNQVSEVLAKHLPDVQIVLFVTPSEYTSGEDKEIPVREILKPTNKIWKEYQISTCKTEEGESTRCFEEYNES